MAVEASLHGGDLFAIAREQGWDWRSVRDFSASINPLGPSPHALEAIRAAIPRLVHYSERDSFRLREALAKAWHISTAQVLPGNGATELIYFLARLLHMQAFAWGPVTLALPVFSEFERAFPASANASLYHPETWPRDGVLVLTRPANPSGWLLPLGTLAAYLESTNARVLIDESFLEFSGSPSAASLMARYPNLVVLRSLTKFYALPGLRIGALIAEPALAAEWRRHREPWQVNALAEAAAIAALADEEHAGRSRAFVVSEREWLADRLRALPHTRPCDSSANFLLIELGYSAARLAGHLFRQKILVRNCTGWPGISGEAVRIAVRRREENLSLLAAWGEFLCGG